MLPLKIRTHIIGGFLSISVLIIILSLFSIIATRVSLTALTNLKDEVIVHTLQFMELDRDIIQIQQWLTDVSATRGAPGYDDGYGEAEGYYKAAKGLLSELLKGDYEEPDMLRKLSDMEKQLDAYYSVGRQMADTYVAEGPAGGNVFMGKFDPYAEQLGDNITGIVESHKAELKTVLQDITVHQKKIMIASVILGVTALIVALILSYIVTKSVLSPLLMFKSKFAQGASGDLTVQVDYNIDNEVGELSSSFNSFALSLRELIVVLKNTISDITENSVTLSSASEEFSVTFAQQSSEITTIAGSVETLTESTVDIIKRIESMTALIQNTNKETEEAFTHMENVISKTEEISTDTNNLSLVMVSLVESSGEIENILAVINDIADQTNLLALNAAIEAARAGEAGRGFAVVADEVRKLAERTQKATGEVENIVSQLMSDTNNAKKTMDVSVEKVGEGLELIHNLEKFYKKVSDSMETINSEQGIIYDSMNISAENIEQVNGSIQGISTSIQEASTAVGQIANAATSLQQNAHLLSDRAKTFKV